jgi:hypothetical protein
LRWCVPVEVGYAPARFAADADDLGGNDSALPGCFDVEGQRVEGGFHSLYAPCAFAGAIERERDTASFITCNPPVASRFTPFIPFPLSSIGDGLTIFIRQETQNGSPGAGLWLRDKDNGAERREDCAPRRTAGCSDRSEDDPNRRNVLSSH